MKTKTFIQARMVLCHFIIQWNFGTNYKQLRLKICENLITACLNPKFIGLIKRQNVLQAERFQNQFLYALFLSEHHKPDAKNDTKRKTDTNYQDIK